MLVNIDLHLQKGYCPMQFNHKSFNLTTGGDIACLTVSGTISFSLINRMTTYGIIFISLASESCLFMIIFKSFRADPATKTTDDLVGVIIPWVPRFRLCGVELVRDRWWEGRHPGNLRG